MRTWRVKALFLLAYDLMVVSGAYLLALWLRFDCRFSEIPASYFTSWKAFAPLYSMGSVVVFARLRLYRSIWSFASFTEFLRVTIATVVTTILHDIGITLLYQRMPISYYILGAGIQFLLVLGIRFSYRFLVLERNKYIKLHHMDVSRVMVIGAGAAGEMIMRELHRAKESQERVFCFIDDNPYKWGRDIDGVPIVGGREDILYNVEKYRIEKILLAIPSASAETRRDLLDICKETECELRNLPSLYQLASCEVTVNSIKPVEIEDLLGREPIQVNMDEICSFLTDKTILVTGGGGSIGSELCRQIAKNHPKQLIIFDIYENNAYGIQLELKELYPDLNLVVLIGSVRDSRRVSQVFEKYKPEIVYHAAAHKHVPLMEDSPCESIKNNAIGTYKTAYAAMMNGCKRFVLISTDKAVNPTNIMGASKRVCEMIIQSFDRKIRSGKAHEIEPLYIHSEDADGGMLASQPEQAREVTTEFVAVRFGNVLGSNGSVIPIFKKQIAKGGPVTVTHPDIIRYFMTIPEAASLVLQAGTYAQGGEIFVLDMGSPVKIDTLARNLIRLSGLQPDVDIRIEYTGLRPGEKLYEEKLMQEEGLRTTPNQMIHIGTPIPFSEETFLKQMQEMMEVAYDGDEEKMHELVETVVGTYNHVGEGGSEEKGAAYQQQMQEIAESGR